MFYYAYFLNMLFKHGTKSNPNLLCDIQSGNTVIPCARLQCRAPLNNNCSRTEITRLLYSSVILSVVKCLEPL
jgi:hypothetical protein